MPRWMIALIGILAALGGFYALTFLPKSALPPLLPAFPSSPIKMEIQNGPLTLSFEKKDGPWRVNRPLEDIADPERMGRVLDGLRNLSSEEILTRRPESHSLYQVDDSSGIFIRVWGSSGTEPALWIFGKSSPDGRVYMRVPGRPDVHLVSGVERGDVDKYLGDWRDKRVLSLEGDQKIVRLRVKKPLSTYDIYRSSESWTVDGRPADQEKVKSLLNDIEQWRSNGFINPPFSDDTKRFGFENPRAYFLIQLSSGPAQEIRFGHIEKQMGLVYIRREGRDAVFTYPESLFNEICPDKSALLPSPPKNIP